MTKVIAVHDDIYVLIIEKQTELLRITGRKPDIIDIASSAIYAGLDKIKMTKHDLLSI